MAKRSVTGIERLIGLNIRRLRIKRRMTQQQLGDAIHVSFQQIQKYENGSNRLSVGKFLEIAECLRARPETLWMDTPDRDVVV